MSKILQPITYWEIPCSPLCGVICLLVQENYWNWLVRGHFVSMGTEDCPASNLLFHTENNVFFLFVVCIYIYRSPGTHFIRAFGNKYAVWKSTTTTPYNNENNGDIGQVSQYNVSPTTMRMVGCSTSEEVKCLPSNLLDRYVADRVLENKNETN